MKFGIPGPLEVSGEGAKASAGLDPTFSFDIARSVSRALPKGDRNALRPWKPPRCHLRSQATEARYCVE